MLEIERKFLVNNPINYIEECHFESIKQSYLCLSDDSSEVRLRQSGESYTLTVKKGQGLVREEAEISLNQQQYQELANMAGKYTIEKRRYFLPHIAPSCVLDIYGGPLQGLAVIEVEFDSLASSKGFQAPDWFGLEVTNDERFKNRNIARNGLPFYLNRN